MQTPQSKLAVTKYPVPTSHHGPKFSQALKYGVVHTAQCCSGEPGKAHDLAKYASRSDRSKSSWHYNVDAEVIVQSLDERYIGYHVGNKLNNNSIGIEICVYASANRTEWETGYRAEAVDRTAELAADISTRLGIKMQGLTETAARADAGGWISHSLARKVWGGNNVRTDPGAGFPWQYFMDKMRSYANPETPEQPGPSEPEETAQSFNWLHERISNNVAPWRLVEILLEHHRKPKNEDLVLNLAGRYLESEVQKGHELALADVNSFIVDNL